MSDKEGINKLVDIVDHLTDQVKAIQERELKTQETLLRLAEVVSKIKSKTHPYNGPGIHGVNI